MRLRPLSRLCRDRLKENLMISRYGECNETWPASLPELPAPYLGQRQELLDQLVHLLLAEVRPGEPLPQQTGLGFPAVQVGKVTQVRGAVDYPPSLQDHLIESIDHFLHSEVVDF